MESNKVNFDSLFEATPLSDTDRSCIEKTIEFVKKTLSGSESGHNWFHIERVWKNAKNISKQILKRSCHDQQANGSIESNPPVSTNTANPIINTSSLNPPTKLDLLSIELGALLHDISDYKFNNGDESLGSKISYDFLYSIKVEKSIIEKVVSIIEGVTFKGPKEKNQANSIEAQIVQDADRLDALGAIGIARAFAYGGNKNREIYDPTMKPDRNMNWEQYKNNKSSSLNHFYEKLFLLKDKMNTKEGKSMAEKRHLYMEGFVNKFLKEWEGEDYE
eukprot:CAMPEP_0170517394 /NCGR_PEP_ID=MMETSP0209-20121228/3407_1 /TAXON_ID=665100 ORGANISM="Litonotus pictus, Strain P1" /NCGR_SAMPLE_ID=MMETSP0209 /ASSEMBLY_ACC=CAM_ASM_000301 /LENGTH=275 /DNA_ID=CAMNT_0010802633 /DNA_START=23 /DNA_END=850 /DNA_ORIENTATION=-